MRVIRLQRHPGAYTCNSYLILGTWNRIDDVNTLIDPGIDDFVLEEIGRLSTGLGKVPVEQVILTHSHFDHAAGVSAVKRRFGARVLAFLPAAEVDEVVFDKQFIKVGDDICEILHTPGHSSDSICIYLPNELALFSGDTQIRIVTPGGPYTAEYRLSLEKLAMRGVETIYPGHGEPICSDAMRIIFRTLECVRSASQPTP